MYRNRPTTARMYSIPPRDQIKVLYQRLAQAEATNRQNAEEIRRLKQAEQQLQTLLREKEVLLKEVHHRVKNNFQSVANLLYLQSAQVQNEQMQEMFQEARHRVNSIALIHEKLYQTQDLARIDFGEYVESLTAHLIRAYGATVGVVRLEIQVDRIFLDMDTAIPLGVIVNELVSNSLKHAFPAGWSRLGEIRIKLSATGSQVTLTVSDNGIGLTEAAENVRPNSLGLQLVRMLAQQMRATLTIERNGGTSFRLELNQDRTQDLANHKDTKALRKP